MARTFRTCTEHFACQLETPAGIHHPGDLQMSSPVAPEAQYRDPVYHAEQYTRMDRWWNRKVRKWRRKFGRP